MEKNPIIAVTGGAGFIGSHTVVELQQRGYECVIIDDFSNSEKHALDGIESITGKRPQLEEGSVCDADFLDSVFSKYTFHAVIHFAAFKSVNESVAQPLNYYRNNLTGLTTLLEAMKAHDVKQLIFSSSCTIYGTPEHTRVVSETTPPGIPNSPYGWTKLMGEQILSDFSAANPDFCVVLLRYFNPVGAHVSGKIGELPRGIPNNILPYITQVAAGVLNELTIFGNDYDTADGTCVRDFIHVSDVADAHVITMEKLDGKTGVFVFNVGTGRGTSVLELVNIFGEVTGKKIPYKFGPRRPGDVVAIAADVHKVSEELGWKTSRTVADAVRDSWRWERHLRNL